MGCDLDQRTLAEGHLVSVLSSVFDGNMTLAHLCWCRNDVKPVSIVAIGCLHPVLKVQSASIHFFLGDDDEKEDSDEEEEEVRRNSICLI